MINTSFIFVLVFVSLKQRPGFDHSILGETDTGAGAGYAMSCGPPLAVVKAGAASWSPLLKWEEVGEVNGRQDEYHRLQHLLMSSAGTDNRGSRGRDGMQSGVGSCIAQNRGDAFLGCAVFWFGGREGAGHGVL